jgi:2-dehydro-3-deoxygluconokinase
MLRFNAGKTIAIGEAMVEMAVTGDNTYRRSFAGDTFNTAWHMSRLLGPRHKVGFATTVGADTVSDTFVNELDADGLDVSCIGRDAKHTMGLYMIELEGTERHFHYWRGQSAARHLADDLDWLTSVLWGAGLIHVSGITLAILAPDARARLWDALAQARSHGARVSFDPNLRPKLWASPAETRTEFARFLEITDIALPSFDDEAALWGDGTPEEVRGRLLSAGVTEIAIKNGAGPIVAASDGEQISVSTNAVSDIRDTSGAGDAFNAGYLAARLTGQGQRSAIAMGQRVSAKVIGHFGARIPKDLVPRLAEGAP